MLVLVLVRAMMAPSCARRRNVEPNSDVKLSSLALYCNNEVLESSTKRALIYHYNIFLTCISTQQVMYP